MKLLQGVHWFAALTVATTLVACGGGGGGASGSPSSSMSGVTVTLGAPTAAASQPKQVNLRWAVSGTGIASIADYRVAIKTSGASGYQPVGGPLDATARTGSVLLDLTALDWAQASIKLQACNGAGACADSNEQALRPVLAQAVGYFKASNTGQGDGFGFSVALSTDGNTMAVGAFNEASGATGIGGRESDNSAPNSGAAYVFTRSGTNWSQQSYVKASNTGPNDLFGFSVALSADGGTLAVGAFGEGGGASGIGGDQNNDVVAASGAVYVY